MFVQLLLKCLPDGVGLNDLRQMLGNYGSDGGFLPIGDARAFRLHII